MRFWTRIRLCSPNPKTREKALEQLKGSRDPAAVKAARRALTSDRDPSVRGAAATLLGTMGAHQASQELIHALLDQGQFDQGEWVGACAARALGAIGDRSVVPAMVCCLGLPLAAGVLKTIIGALRNLGDPSAISPLVTILVSERDDKIAEAVEGCLLDFRGHDDLMHHLLSALETGGEFPRRIIRILGKIGDPRAVPSLIQHLEVDSYLAIQSLREIGDRRAIAPIVAYLRKDKHGWVVQDLVALLGKVGCEADAELLTPLLLSPEQYVRANAANVFKSLHWEPTGAEARAAFGVATENWEMVTTAGEAAKDALETFITDHLADKNPSDPCGVVPAICCLLRVDHFQAMEYMWRWVRARGYHVGHKWEERAVSEFCDALGQVGGDAVSGITKALADPDIYVRAVALRTLSTLRDPSAVDALLEAVANEAEDSRVRMAAIESLGALKDPRAVKPLIALLRDDSDDVRRTAVRALGHMPDVRAVEPLIEVARREPSPSVVESLCELLESVGSALDAASLQVLSRLDDLTFTPDAHYSDATGSLEQSPNVRVDCSHLRRLARTELARRHESA